jgi:hypothetical protein
MVLSYSIITINHSASDVIHPYLRLTMRYIVDNIVCLENYYDE